LLLSSGGKGQSDHLINENNKKEKLLVCAAHAPANGKSLRLSDGK
jgi:hypothetical protein